MSKLLTIAIPTYNRADALDRQLLWLSQALQGHESECEIFVSDNASSDRTPEIIQHWQSKLPQLSTTRQPENVGVLKNVAHCLRAATTPYVWAIGDDDPIQDRAIPYVLQSIKQQPNLSLIFLNFSGRNKITGEPVHPPTIMGNRWFDISSEALEAQGQNGKAIFEQCFEKSVGAVIFLSAIVYRTAETQTALKAWETADENWIFLAYLAGCCAAQGTIIVTPDNYLECIVGVSYWQKDQKAALLMQYQHYHETLLKLEEAGYSPQFCRRMIVRSFRESSPRVLLGAFRRWPLFTLKTALSFWGVVGSSALKLRN